MNGAEDAEENYEDFSRHSLISTPIYKQLIVPKCRHPFISNGFLKNRGVLSFYLYHHSLTLGEWGNPSKIGKLHTTEQQLNM